MKWNKYTINTTEEAEDLIVSMLDDLGIEGAEIEDKAPLTPEETGNLFGDVIPEMPEDDHIAAISFYLEPDKADPSLLEDVKKGLDDLRQYIDVGDGTIEYSETEDIDWINNWKEHFHSFRIDNILIVPTWERETNNEKAEMTLYIDPGTAFGTGKHDTTQLIIKQLKKYIKPGTRMLDVGTGSGILGIVALKYGAAHVTGLDIDPVAFPALEENLVNNGISDVDFERRLGNIGTDEDFLREVDIGGYDLITANIIAEILEDITPQAARLIKKGGVYIMSGLLNPKEEMAADTARRCGFKILDTVRQGEWSSIAAIRQ